MYAQNCFGNTSNNELEIHACVQNPSPQYIKDATIFLEHEVFQTHVLEHEVPSFY